MARWGGALENLHLNVLVSTDCENEMGTDCQKGLSTKPARLKDFWDPPFSA